MLYTEMHGVLAYGYGCILCILLSWSNPSGRRHDDESNIHLLNQTPLPFYHRDAHCLQPGSIYCFGGELHQFTTAYPAHISPDGRCMEEGRQADVTQRTSMYPEPMLPRKEGDSSERGHALLTRLEMASSADQTAVSFYHHLLRHSVVYLYAVCSEWHTSTCLVAT